MPSPSWSEVTSEKTFLQSFGRLIKDATLPKNVRVLLVELPGTQDRNVEVTGRVHAGEKACAVNGQIYSLAVWYMICQEEEEGSQLLK